MRCSLLPVLLASAPLLAQPSPATADRRFAFADTYLGLEVAAPLGRGTVPIGPGLAPGTFESTPMPRLMIGGLHFWGHVDFHINVPIGPLRKQVVEPASTAARAGVAPGIETGVRWYPWALRDGSLRPFVGTSFARYRVAAQGTAGGGPMRSIVRAPLSGGLTYATPTGLFEVGGQWLPQRDFVYPGAAQAVGEAQLPGAVAWVGYKRRFEATRSLAAPVKDGTERRRDSAYVAEGRMAGPFIGIGFSTATQITASTFNTAYRPMFDARLPGATFPELAIGWEDALRGYAVVLTARQWELAQEAFGLAQSARRRSVALEVSKFLFDWHGFVPFVGLQVGRDAMHVRERTTPRLDGTPGWGAEPPVDIQRTRWVPGLVVGWDIQPSRTQPIVLRTNLRYAPNLALDLPGGTRASFSHLEFNFIQVVWHLRK
jgi:hypothetical protein